MVRPFLPLNGLRAFEASARRLSFTRAAIELCVTQAAVSQQVKSLEARLGAKLFHRLPRGLKLTAEGEALLPTVSLSFDKLADTLGRVEGGHVRELLFVGAVGTFAIGWLLPRLADFQQQFPYIDCDYRRTTIGLISLRRVSILPSASAAEPGMPRIRSASLMHHCRRSAFHEWPRHCASPPILPIARS